MKNLTDLKLIYLYSFLLTTLINIIFNNIVAMSGSTKTSPVKKAAKQAGSNEKVAN